jgi:hypothetical protein
VRLQAWTGTASEQYAAWEAQQIGGPLSGVNRKTSAHSEPYRVCEGFRMPAR